MRVAVAGLWHLGTVTAACCAYGGHDVVAFDDDLQVVAKLKQNELPVEEPGLADLIASGVHSQRLSFAAERSAVASCDVLWVCYDTPVDENDRADTDFVFSRVEKLMPHLSAQTTVLISSQLPVGSTAKLNRMRPELTFAYSPENLRLGKAIEVFLKPDRVVVGIRDQHGRTRISSLLAPFTDRIEWMSVESAEMTKHALNAFLATSVAFINELATICEKTGADALDVERGLKSDIRIGKRAYLHPGSAFAGGTLARDISFLLARGREHGVPVHLLAGVNQSNEAHKLWARRRLTELLGHLQGKIVSILGLTYKAGTNTLRRSASIEMCDWLAERGVAVQAFDPAITELPCGLKNVLLAASAEQALAGADAALIATPWQEFRSISSAAFIAAMCRPLILDPDRHLESAVREDRRIEYFSIGAANEASA